LEVLTDTNQRHNELSDLSSKF